MSHGLDKLLNGVCKGDYMGTIIGVIQGDTRSLDHGSFKDIMLLGVEEDGMF